MFRLLFCSHLPAVAALLAALAATAAAPDGNLLALREFQAMSRQYEADARGALAQVRALKKRIVDEGPAAAAAAAEVARAEGDRIHLAAWQHADSQFEAMLRNPAPARAAAAAAERAAPFAASIARYTAAQQAYDASSAGFALRAKQDAALAQQLQAMSHQMRTEETEKGDGAMAEQYAGQAAALMAQGDGFAKVSAQYHRMATKIYAAIPQLQREVGMAAAFGAWQENPGNALGAEYVLPYAPVKPTV